MLFAARLLLETRIWLALLLVGLFLVAPAAARAEGEDPAVLAKVTALNKKALDAYNNLEFEEARKLLKQALDLCGTAGLDKHPIKARTHIHMGVVLIAEKQQELGVKQFKKALDIQPDIQVTKEMANPEILQAFEEAGAASGGGGGGAEPGSDEPGAGSAASSAAGEGAGASDAPPSDISHMPISRGRKGKPIPIVATVSPDLTGYTKVVLEYKPEGAPEFLEIEMRRSGNKFSAVIPPDATKGNRLAYYIEAEAADETTIASSATEEKPNYVVLAPAGRGDDDGDEEADDDGPRFFIGVLGGTGFGYTTGNGEVNNTFTVKAGFAPASLGQVAPEIGYFITPQLRLSIQARYQYVSGTTPAYLDKLNAKYPARNINLAQCGSDQKCTSATFAFAVLAKGSWFFGSGSFRPYISGTLGGGQLRHVVHFTASPKDCGPRADETCVDTVLAGPVFVGPGGGVLFSLTPNFGLVAELNSVFGFPKFTFNLDLNAGVAARF